MKFLTEDQKKSYQKNGFIKLANIFSDRELEDISKAYDDLFHVRNIPFIIEIKSQTAFKIGHWKKFEKYS